MGTNRAEYYRQYYAKNRDKLNANARASYHRHGEERRAQLRAYRDRPDVKERDRAYHQHNKKDRLKQMKERRAHHLTELQRIKLEQGCSSCGYAKNPAALDFHHTEPTKKEAQINTLYHTLRQLPPGRAPSMSNIIEVDNVWATFAGPNLMQARSLLRFRQKGYTFSPAYKAGVWDGWVSLFSRAGGFPAGLVPWLVTRLGHESIKVEVKDTRPPVTGALLFGDLTNSTEFRPHQVEAIAAGLEKERGIVHQPTGSGKTEVMIELTRLIGRQCLVLVHRKDLLHQTARRFAETLNVGNDVIGVIGDGVWEPRGITIATFQTLARRLKERDEEVKRWLQEDISQVHVDEAHHLPAKTYERVMTQLFNARWRLGYSATPDKEGDLETMFKVSAHLGPTIHRATGTDLIDKGHLVPVDVFMVRVPPSAVAYQDYDGAIQYGIVENVTRNQMIGDIARKCSTSSSGPVVILVERIAHGERLAWELGTEFVSGSSPTAVRQRAWTRLKEGSLHLLVTSKIADEGLDIPPLSYLILAGGGKAPHVTIQRVGRGMRTAKGKQNLFVFDFLDTGKWLSAHSKARSRTYNTQAAYTVQDVDIEEVT